MEALFEYISNEVLAAEFEAPRHVPWVGQVIAAPIRRPGGPMTSEAELGYRGGGQETVAGDQIDDALRRLVAQMLTEEHEAPDDEHAQAYVRRSDGAAVTAYVDGLLVFEAPAGKRYAVVQTGAEMQNGREPRRGGCTTRVARRATRPSTES